MSGRRVFISYSHKDETWKNRLTSKLGVLERENLLAVWSDEKISAGSDWRAGITEALDSASVAVLLISDDFLTSSFIRNEEVPRILLRREKEGLRVFPIVIRPCVWDLVPWLSRLQVRPRGKISLSQGNEYEIEVDLSNIVREIVQLEGLPGAREHDTPPPRSGARGPGGARQSPTAIPAAGLRAGVHADLVAELQHYDSLRYRIELRFTQSGPDSDNQRLRGWAHLDLEAIGNLAHDPAGYGAHLTQQIFPPGRMASLLEHARKSAALLRVPLRVRICVPANARELHRIRWELLRTPHDDALLQAQPDIVFSRYLVGYGENWRDVRMRHSDSLSALIVSASTAGEPPEADYKAFGLAKVLPIAEATPSRISTELHRPGGYDVLVIRCRLSGPSEDPCLVLPGDDGEPSSVPTSKISHLIRGLPAPPRLVVLSPVLDEHTGPLDFAQLARIAPTLAESGVAGVLVPQDRVKNEDWSTFLSQYFQDLQAHGFIDLAMKAAGAFPGDEFETAVPALFLRVRCTNISRYSGFIDRRKSEAYWDALLSGIAAGRCTPIIGEEVSDEVAQTRRDVAQRLADSKYYPMDFHDRLSLSRVAQYLSVDPDKFFVHDQFCRVLQSHLLNTYRHELPHDSERLTLEELVSAIGDARRRGNRYEPYKVLASLPLPLYITTSQIPLLGDSLRAVAPKKPREAIFPVLSLADATPPPDLLSFRPTKDNPLVYHLFGRVDRLETLVLTEDDHLEFLRSFASNSPLMPTCVPSALTNTSLLFLGFKLHAWDFRVLFRSIMGMEGRARRRSFSHVAVQIDPDDDSIMDPERARAYLEEQLSVSSISIFWGSAEQFLSELASRWERARGA